MITITDRDRGHMNTFPIKKKERIMQRIMAKPPMSEWNFEGYNNYAKAMLKLRTGGLGLIDLQPQETAFTTVWYGKNGTLMNWLKSDAVALLLWESNGDDKAILRIWHI